MARFKFIRGLTAQCNHEAYLNGLLPEDEDSIVDNRSVTVVKKHSDRNKDRWKRRLRKQSRDQSAADARLKTGLRRTLKEVARKKRQETIPLNTLSPLPF